MNPTHKRLAEIKQRCEAATKGPWQQDRYTRDGSNDLMPQIGNKHFEICVASYLPQDSERNVKNATFIAHARTDIPCLLEALSVALDGLEEYATEEGSGHKTHYWAVEILKRIERIMGGD